MKALTIWQPWASLIMAGAKPWEWRGWKPPRSMIGQRIVIHAGVRAPKLAEIVNVQEVVREGDSSLVGPPTLALLGRTPLRAWPLACGLGTAILGQPVAALDWAAQHLKPGYDSDRINHHMFAWPLTDIEAFEPFVPARGMQGFWNWAP